MPQELRIRPARPATTIEVRHARPRPIDDQERRQADAAGSVRRVGGRLLFGLALVVGLAASPARADFVINFDSLPASGHPVSGPALANYLAGYGVTLSAVTPGTQVEVLDARDIYSGLQPVVPPSPFNVIIQGDSLDPISYSLNFAQPLSRFSFTRPTIRAGATGIIIPEWHASAYDASGKLLASAGEALRSTFSDVPASVFTLTGQNIARVEIDSNNQHVAAFGAIMLDDFTLTAVPEPGSLVLFGTGALAALGYRWRRRGRVTA